jgi:imidazolonepropionase-like amidohydrolase
MMTAMTQRSSVVITHAYVVPVSTEPIENGTVLIEDGVITAVGTMRVWECGA